MNYKDFTIVVASQFKRNTVYKTIESIMKIDASSLIGEFILVFNSPNPLPGITFHHPSIEFKIIVEAVPGHSIALNTGVRNAAGNIIVFTDDDAIVSPNWIKEYLKGMNNNQIGYSFGRIFIDLNTSPPLDWFDIAPQHLCGLDYGDEYIDFNHIDKKGDCIGVNMAINRRILEHGILFNENLGPSPLTGNVGGADTLLGRQILQNKYIGRYIPNASVTHFVEIERLSFLYLLKRKYKIGQTAIAYDFMLMDKCFVPRINYFISIVLRNLLVFFLCLWKMNRVMVKKSLLKLFRSLGSLSVIVLKRGCYESLRKENYLFSSQ